VGVVGMATVLDLLACGNTTPITCYPQVCVRTSYSPHVSALHHPEETMVGAHDARHKTHLSGARTAQYEGGGEHGAEIVQGKYSTKKS